MEQMKKTGRPSAADKAALKATVRVTSDGDEYQITEYIKMDNLICTRLTDGMSTRATMAEVEKGLVRFSPVGFYTAQKKEELYNEFCERLLADPRFRDMLRNAEPASRAVKMTGKSWNQFLVETFPDIGDKLDNIPTGTRLFYEEGASLCVHKCITQKSEGTLGKQSLDMCYVDMVVRWPLVCEMLNIPADGFQMYLHLSDHFKQERFKLSLERLQDKGVVIDFQDREEYLCGGC